MTRSLAVSASVALLALPATASAAPSLSVSPQKRCYSSGETVNLLAGGFSPLATASVSRDGEFLRALNTDGNGAFNGVLTLGLQSGRETRTYTATDDVNSTLTASTQLTVSSVGVKLKPENGTPGRLLTISAHGFTTGDTLWAHVRHRKSKRNVRLGKLHGACGKLKTRKRLLKRNSRFGVHTVQFDTFRRFKRDRPVADHYTITVEPAA
jgi:hypothetical protein